MRRAFLLAASLAVLAIYTTSASAAPHCNGKSGYDWARCMERENIRLSKRLGGNWKARLDRYFKECARQFPGGGSAGRDDRLICVYQKLQR